jgi:hypothetical protein
MPSKCHLFVLQENRALLLQVNRRVCGAPTSTDAVMLRADPGTGQRPAELDVGLAVHPLLWIICSFS